MRNTVRVIDLFAGAGGISAGLHVASERFQTVAAVEMSPAAAASFESTFGEGIVFMGDISDWLEGLSSMKADVVVGGPPCQGFSSLGKQDAQDERNFLWREYVHVIRKVEPKYFVVENVAQFRRSPQYELFRSETNPLGEISDYEFECRILNSADYGSPQVRQRAVIIGHHRDLPSPGFPERAFSSNPARDGLPRYRTVADALKDVPCRPDRDEVFDCRRREFFGTVFAGPFSPRDLHWSRNYSDLSLSRFRVIPAGGNRYDLEPYPDLMAPCWIRHKTGSGDVMGRLSWDKPSVTIRTEFFKPEKGRYLHPDQDRAITHYEAALIQGFRPWHRFVGSKTEIARQIGNAVPVDLGAAIGRSLANVLV